jgi:hypothetical protein
MSDEIFGTRGLGGEAELKLLLCRSSSVSAGHKYGFYSVSFGSNLLSASCKTGVLQVGPSSAGGLLWTAICNFFSSCDRAAS